ncbi:MAG: hypothetical protein Q9187_001918 [Circinaria calcarea]
MPTENGDVTEHTSLLSHLTHPLRKPNGDVLYHDERPWVRWPATAAHLTYATLASNYVNVLLVFVPLGIIAGALHWSPTWIFVLNFLAIIPLASLLSFATEELSVKLGQTLGGLLNATFGNAVELIISIVALKNGEIRIVQSSMLGSILSNILLVLGCCFFAGGIKYHEQHFNETVASTMSSLMAVASACLIIPATLYGVMDRSTHAAGKDEADGNILVLSHGTAVIMLFLYILYLYFQLKTHASLFDEEENTDEGHRKPPEEAKVLGPWAAGVALVVITIAVAVCAEFLVDSIDSIVQTAHISKTFIGLILLPIVGNAAEHVTAIVVSVKDKMDLAIGVAIGSSMQIALLVTPFLVILGWIIGQPMTLHFETFETVVFFLSVLVVNYLIQDGKSNYLEGAMLIGTYAIIALAFYVYPDNAVSKGHKPSISVKSALLALLIIASISYFSLRSRDDSVKPVWSSTQSQTAIGVPSIRTQIDFWRSFQALLSLSKPDCPSPVRNGTAGAVGFEATKELSRPDITFMPDEDVELMRAAHVYFVDSIKANAPKLSYAPGTRGVVTTAGGAYLPVLVISLRMLRRTGSTLPVEVFLSSTSEYEGRVCRDILPSLNARCLIISDILDAVPGSVTIAHYQLKPFAMLFSSFEEILFLDADSFPIHDPEELFTSEPFISHGMVLWPDFWISTASPLYYNISGQPVPPVSRRQSSETGEIVVSKKSHHQSLLLAAYYNYYGPSHFYILQSQGAPGEGDKETFAAAADALNETYYATSERVRPIGAPKEDGGTKGSAMVQYDPREDYNLTKQGLWRVKDLSVAESPRAFFIHANFPKFNPSTIFHEGGPTKDPNGNDRRAWTVPSETIEALGMDLEMHFWEEIKWTGCELEHAFRSWNERHDICSQVTKYWNSVFGTAGRRSLVHHEASKMR